MSAAPRGRILVDVTELVHNPISTGIQRVARSLLRHWPDPDELILCRYTPSHGLVRLPPAVLDLLRMPSAGSAAQSVETLRRDIAAHLGSLDPVASNLPILVPEVFFDLNRCAHHAWLLSHWERRTSFLAFDFIPWLHPDFIGVQESAHLMHYIQLLRRAERVGFISAATRHDFATRITRRRSVTGPVLSLGADGPGTPRQDWSPTRDTFLCIGSIDGRKNQGDVIRAFELLWLQGSTAKLTLVGHIFDGRHVQDLARTIERLAATEPRFKHVSGVSDEAMNALYSQARACIYASQIEGFGLPPVESLHCGTPVIVYHALPSIQALPPDGQIRLDTVDPTSIAQAVLSLHSDQRAQQLWRAAASVQTKTWRDMANEVAAWMRSKN